MSPTCHPYVRRATTSVLVAVALVSGGILLLGDRFDAVPSYALSQPARAANRIAACVAEESMRLINPDREQCQPGELQLASERTQPSPEPGPAGPAGPAGVDGVSGFEIVTANLAVPSRQSASGAARCPTGKVALGGGVQPAPEISGRGGEPEDRMNVVLSAPLLPAGGGGYGWTATVRNAGAAARSAVIAAVCVTLR